MAAVATRKPPADSHHRRRPAVPVEQPPRTILIGGQRVDVSHLTGDELYEAITRDEEQWDYKRLSAETGRSVVRLRKWVSNAYASNVSPPCALADPATGEAGEVADDKTFMKPCGIVGGSPWWHAGESRDVLNQIGVMHRDGRAKPYRPTGRSPGAKDLAPRKRWAHAPMRDTAADVYREYRELTARKRAPLSDEEARAELRERHNLTDRQVARRINAGGDSNRKWDSAEERDAAFAVYREYRELTTHKRPPVADREARAELCRRHNLSRTQLARRIKEGQAQTQTKKGAAAAPVEVDNTALRARHAELFAAESAAGYSDRGADGRARDALATETGLTRRQLAARIAAAGAADSTTGGDG